MHDNRQMIATCDCFYALFTLFILSFIYFIMLEMSKIGRVIYFVQLRCFFPLKNFGCLINANTRRDFHEYQNYFKIFTDVT